MAGIDLMLRYSSKKKKPKEELLLRNELLLLLSRFLNLLFSFFLFEFLATLFSPTPWWFWISFFDYTTKHQFHAWDQIVVVSFIAGDGLHLPTGFYPFQHQSSDDGSELSFKFQHSNKQEETTPPKDLTLKRRKQQARGRKRKKELSTRAHTVRRVVW